MTQKELNHCAQEFGSCAVDGETAYVFTGTPFHTGGAAYPSCCNAITCRELRGREGGIIPAFRSIRVFYNELNGYTKISEGAFISEEDVFALHKKIEYSFMSSEEKNAWKSGMPSMRHHVSSFMRRIQILDNQRLHARIVPGWISVVSTRERLSMEISCKDERPIYPHNFQKVEKLTVNMEEDDSTLPENLVELTNLKELILNGYAFERFPSEIFQLPSLESLHITFSHTGAERFMDDLASLTNLRELHLFSHDIDIGKEFALPVSIINLKELNVLELGIEALVSLPADIDKLQELRKLNIGSYDFFDWENGATLTTLPDSLCNLDHLEFLDISACGSLTILPQNFGKLTSLKSLNICGSGISRLCLTDEQLSRLETFWTQGTLPDLTKAIRLKDFSWRKMEICPCAENATEAYLAKLLPCVPSIEILQLIGGDYEDLDFIFEMPNLKKIKLYCRPRRMPDKRRIIEQDITLEDYWDEMPLMYSDFYRDGAIWEDSLDDENVELAYWARPHFI